MLHYLANAQSPIVTQILTDIKLGFRTRFQTVIFTSQFDIQVTINFVTIQGKVRITVHKENTLVLILFILYKSKVLLSNLTELYFFIKLSPKNQKI